MKETRILMGMPVTVEIVDSDKKNLDEISMGIEKVYKYFTYVDEKFSTYKETSEITKINKHLLKESELSEDMKEVFVLSEDTKRLTHGYFNIQKPDGSYDPSGLVKGWAIYKAARLLVSDDFKNFYIDAGGDIQVVGKNLEKETWNVGIKNPFKQEEIIKVVYLNHNEGVATSGTYIRGQHIYNPYNQDQAIIDIVSLTVIGPNIYEADRFATAAFAMGREGINFIEKLPGFEGYMIDSHGMATMTSQFETYTHKPG